jgi:hypothetical protein
VIVPDLEHKRSTPASGPPNGPPGQKTPEEGSSFRLAAYAFVVGGVALTLGKVATSRLNPSEEPVRLGFLAAVAIGVTVLAGYFGDSILHHVRRAEDRIRQRDN